MKRIDWYNLDDNTRRRVFNIMAENEFLRDELITKTDMVDFYSQKKEQIAKERDEARAENQKLLARISALEAEAESFEAWVAEMSGNADSPKTEKCENA